LREKTQQPEVYLKEVLSEIATLHRSGEFNGTWELMPSFKGDGVGLTVMAMGYNKLTFFFFSLRRSRLRAWRSCMSLNRRMRTHPWMTLMMTLMTRRTWRRSNRTLLSSLHTTPDFHFVSSLSYCTVLVHLATVTAVGSSDLRRPLMTVSSFTLCHPP
jgi:hypothetical protein